MTRCPTGIAAALAVCVSLAGCTTNPATGEKLFTPFMGRSQEAAIVTG